MIRQTQLIFRITALGLEVFQLTSVGSKTPLIETSSYVATVNEEIWWSDKENIEGHGPFQTVYGAMKHYNAYKASEVPKPKYYGEPADVVSVDFNARKRIDEGT